VTTCGMMERVHWQCAAVAFFFGISVVLNGCGSDADASVPAPVPAPVDAPSLLKPNPDLLTWQGNPAEMERLNGFLTVPLAPEMDNSPKLRLAVRMKPAKTQPAPLGTVLVHCGGPGSDKTCLDQQAGEGSLDPEIADDYNIFAIDQRGLGESGPQLVCPNPVVSLPPLGQMSGPENFTTCPCELPDVHFAQFNEDPEEAELHYFEGMQKQLLACYNSPHLQLDGFNVMDYLGTSYLAHDLNVFRQAIGAEKLSVHGVSYGTWVGSVYASLYPEYSDKIVLDSNLPPAVTAPDFSRDYAQNEQKVRAEMVARCSATGGCTEVLDPEDAFLKSTAALDGSMFTAPTDFGTVTITSGYLTRLMHDFLRDNTHLIHQFPVPTPIGDLANYRLYAQVLEVWALAAEDPEANRTKRAVKALDRSCRLRDLPLRLKPQCVDKDGTNLALDEKNGKFDCPTWKQYGFCANTGDNNPSMLGNLVYAGVMSSDVPSRLLPSQQLQLTQSLKKEFGPTGDLAGHVMEVITLWPGKPVYPGIGTDEVSPLIIGVVDDSATAFEWTQQMKLAFPAGHLMTFQGYFHILGSPFTMLSKDQDSKGLFPCIQNLKHYFLTEELPRNGYTCHLTGYYNPSDPNLDAIMQV